MKKIKIYSVLSNNDNETTSVEALGEYNENEGIIKYTEENLKVEIKILDNKVIMKRKNLEYDLNLEFKENERIKCKYDVKTIGLDLEVEVYTKRLEIDENRIYIEYELFNDNKTIGKFEFKLLFME